MGSNHLINLLRLLEALVSGCGDCGPRRSVPPVCRIFYSNVRGLSANNSDLPAASSQYDILFFVMRLSFNNNYNKNNNNNNALMCHEITGLST